MYMRLLRLLQPRLLPLLFLLLAALAPGGLCRTDDADPIGASLQVTVGNLSAWSGGSAFLQSLRSSTKFQRVSPLSSDQYADVTIMLEKVGSSRELIVRHGYQGVELAHFPLTPNPTDACKALLRNEQTWQAWLTLHNPKPTNLHVRFRIVPCRIQKDADGHDAWAADLPLGDGTFHAGDYFTIEVSNQSQCPVYVNLVDLFEGDVSPMWPEGNVPNPEAVAPAPTDHWIKLSRDGTANGEPDTYHFTPSANPTAFPDEYVKLIATAEPLNLRLYDWGSARHDATLNDLAQGNMNWGAATLLLSVENQTTEKAAASADMDTPDATDFDTAARQHKISLFDMSEVRSTLFQTTSAPDASWQNVSEWLQSEYPAGTGVLFYAYSAPTLRAWVITGNGIQAYSETSIPQEALESSLATLREALGVTVIAMSRAPRLRHPTTLQRAAMRGMEADNQAASMSLADAVQNVDHWLLPPPVAQAIAPIQRLIVVPTLDIGTVPFAILTPFGTTDALVDRMSVSVAPSLYDLNGNTPAWLGGGATWTARAPLVVGNPDLSHDPEYVYPPLPGAAQEAKAVATTLACPAPRLLTGPQASLPAVLKWMPSSDVVYLATHGVADSVHPLTGNFLALTPGQKDNGRLTQDYIDKHRILGTTRLAVLSACQTGLGQALDAGTISLARGFQIAGVPRVVMSLWSVNDQATTLLMKSFVSRLKNEIPADALRDAMLERRRQDPNPADWASFVLFGTPR